MKTKDLERKPDRSIWRGPGTRIGVFLVVALMAAVPFLSMDASARATDGGMVGLGTLGGSASYGNDINDLGKVVGASFTASQPYQNWHAFTWTRQNGMTDINPPGSAYSNAKAINDRGDIVGYYLPAGGQFDRGCLWTARGGFVDLGALWGGPDTIAYARDINDNGLIVGVGYTHEDIVSPSYYVGHAIIWTKGPAGYGCHDLGTLPGGDMAWAYGINDRNEVVGVSAVLVNGAMEYHPFLWTARGGMVDLGLPDQEHGPVICAAFSINDRGQMVGHYLLPNVYGEPTLADGGFTGTDRGRGLRGVAASEGHANSYVQGINVWGDTVGAVWTVPYYERHAVLWSHGQSRDLGTLPDGTDSYAQSINMFGAVVGTSSGWTDYGMSYQATVWTT